MVRRGSTYVTLHECATNAGNSRVRTPRYDRLNKTIAVSKLDLYLQGDKLIVVSTPDPCKRVGRLTYASWRSSPWVSFAALRFDATFSL